MWRSSPTEIGKRSRAGRSLILALVLAWLISAGGAVNGSSVPTFAGDAQHTAIFQPAAQNLNAIRWQASIDLNPSGGFAHYGAPLITAANTVLAPVKTANNGFQVNAFDGASGVAKYTLTTDYILPSYNWVPTYNPALATHLDGALQAVTRLYYAGAGGTIYHIDNPDANSPGVPVQEAFYGLNNYQANPTAFNASIFINTPITADSAGNVFFGFRVQNTAPAPLNTTQGGFARIDPNGNAIYVLAGTAAGDASISRDSHNSAPALSDNEGTLYVVVKSPTTAYYGYLLGLNTTTLATKYKAFLRDPRNGNNAGILDDSTASPTVAPDGDVFLGIFGNPDNGSRGFLLRFSGDLGTEKTPGAFGWDYTPAIVPASMVPSYTGASSYLIFTKYNNYAISDGDGINKIALLDPNATQIDPHPSANGLVEMREVLTVSGPTPDDENWSPTYPNAKREWCINTAAVNPATQSIFAPCEDGRIYRWDLGANSLSQAVRLTPGIGEPYVPTIIGPDGTVFTLNGGTLFALGATGGIDVTLASSNPDLRNAVVGQPLTFTATVTTGGASASGTVTFQDVYYPEQVLTASTNLLAQNVQLVAGQAAITSSSLGAGIHFITATYDGTTAGVTRVQKIHLHSTTTTVTASPNPSAPGQAVTFTATVTSPSGGTPTGMVTFQESGISLAQVPLNAGAASFSTSSLGLGSHTVTAVYASDLLCASSSGSTSVSVQDQNTTTSVTSSANPLELNQSVTFTATVTPVGVAGTPVGTIAFLDGASALASGIPVDGSGRASYSTATLTVGNHVITAAFTGTGNWQNSSASFTQVVQDTTPPSQPTGLNTTPGPGRKQITLRWNANPPADLVASYEVWRSTSQNGTYAQIATVAATSYVDSGANGGQTRWYYLVARDGSGNRSVPSDKVSGKAK